MVDCASHTMDDSKHLILLGSRFSMPTISDVLRQEGVSYYITYLREKQNFLQSIEVWERLAISFYPVYSSPEVYAVYPVWSPAQTSRKSLSRPQNQNAGDPPNPALLGRPD